MLVVYLRKKAMCENYMLRLIILEGTWPEAGPTRGGVLGVCGLRLWWAPGGWPEATWETNR